MNNSEADTAARVAETQVFKTVITPMLTDPLDLFEHNTAATVGIAAEVHVFFSCTQEPKIERTVITGLNQVGFIISSEYEVNAYIDKVRRKRCEMADCTNAIQYEIDIRFIVYLVIGVGFGLGWGTGTAGYRRRKSNRTQSYVTRCICCNNAEVTP